MKTASLEGRRRVIIERDYSSGISIKFKSSYPPDISHLVDEDTWSRFISELNYLLEKAEAVNARTVCDTLLGCLTCYLIRLCTVPYGYKQINKVDDFITETNKRTMIPRGVLIYNPIERGFRVLELTLINEKYEPSMEVYQNVPRNHLVPK